MRSRAIPTQLRVEAPAKVNLHLAVVARRADGFHDLETVMSTVNLFDTLNLGKRNDGQIEFWWQPGLARTGIRVLDSALMPMDDRNLVVRAALLLKNYAKASDGVSIALTKRIPTEAGLGGGSTNAAATLWGLNRLWDLNLETAEIVELAAQLGSDVPFFAMRTGLALCHGRGERIEALSARDAPAIVMAKPASGLSTAAVFRACHPDAGGMLSERVISGLRDGRWSALARSLRNDLQRPAAELNGDVTRLQKDFDRFGLPFHAMSGSGSTWFGLCDTLCQARRCAGVLRARGWPWVFAGQCRAVA